MAEKKTKTKRKKALGRGLSGLIPADRDNRPIRGGAKKQGNEIRDLGMSRIVTNPNNPRKNFDELKLKEMADSLKAIGLIQPITVEPTDGDAFQIVAGERRYRAARLAGFQKIPAIVVSNDNRQNSLKTIVENIQREDLDPLEEAGHYKMLIDSLGYKQSELAQIVGKNRTTITNKLRLLNLGEEIKSAIRDGNVTEGQVRPLLNVQNSTRQQKLLKRIIEEGLNSRQVEEMVRGIQEPGSGPRNPKKTPKKDPSVRKLENQLRMKLGSKVDINHNAGTGRGKITVEYFSTEDLERIAEILGVKL